MMEQYGSIMNMMNNSNTGGSGGNGGNSNNSNDKQNGGGVSRRKILMTRITTAILVAVVMQLFHYRSLVKINKKHKKIEYEYTIVHPYNHCIEAMSDKFIQSKGGIDLDSLEEICSPLNGSKESNNKYKKYYKNHNKKHKKQREKVEKDIDKKKK